ncbi:MAG: hypothetical protein U0452_10280 [Anaerolineae bacterium]
MLLTAGFLQSIQECIKAGAFAVAFRATHKRVFHCNVMLGAFRGDLQLATHAEELRTNRESQREVWAGIR